MFNVSTLLNICILEGSQQYFNFQSLVAKDLPGKPYEIFKHDPSNQYGRKSPNKDKL